MRLWEFRIRVTFSGLEAWSQLLWMWMALFTDNVLSESGLNDFLTKCLFLPKRPLTMRCGNQRCASIGAVHVATERAEYGNRRGLYPLVLTLRALRFVGRAVRAISVDGEGRTSATPRTTPCELSREKKQG